MERFVYGLISNVNVATRLAKTAKVCHVLAHHFDKAEKMAAHARQTPPVLVILDWDECEGEAFKFLSVRGREGALKKIPAVGYLSQAKRNLIDEAQKAGCDRVYMKTHFFKELELLFARYVV